MRRVHPPRPLPKRQRMLKRLFTLMSQYLHFGFGVTIGSGSAFIIGGAPITSGPQRSHMLSSPRRVL